MENKQTPAPEQAPEIKEGFFLRRPDLFHGYLAHHYAGGRDRHFSAAR